MNETKDLKYCENEILRLNETIIKLQKVEKLSQQVIDLLKLQNGELHKIIMHQKNTIQTQETALLLCEKFLDEKCSKQINFHQD